MAGGKLKETGLSLWKNPNTGATNESGFTASPSGYRINGFFSNIGYTCYWWSSSLGIQSINAGILAIEHDNDSVNIAESFVGFGFSVRCLKD